MCKSGRRTGFMILSLRENVAEAAAAVRGFQRVTQRCVGGGWEESSPQEFLNVCQSGNVAFARLRNKQLQLPLCCLGAIFLSLFREIQFFCPTVCLLVVQEAPPQGACSKPSAEGRL